MLSGEAYQLSWIMLFFFLHLLVPGPNMLYLCTVASRGGRREAVMFSLGTSLGTTLWAAFVALGMWQILESLHGIAGFLQVSLAFALLVFGSLAIYSSFNLMPVGVKTGRPATMTAFLQGLFVTIANANQFVFWTAILAIGTGTDFSNTAILFLITGVAMIALAFDLAFALLVTGPMLADRIMRFRRFLEMGLGGAFCLVGVDLLI